MDYNLDNINNLSSKDISKILFIFNALEDGWTIKKRNDKYIFSKHKGKVKEIMFDSFLTKFINKYLNIDN
tara:strand:- start:165 stop:374 length:210 start_codon:yes stop_codon:yes gene_type:complete